MNFTWSTATETGNLGFNLYAEQGGELVQVNDELIPSQAVDSLNRLDYNYAVKADGNIFYIEDVDIFGETRLHGPFALGEAYGERVEADQINWPAIQKENQAVEYSSQSRIQPSMGVVERIPNGVVVKVRETGLYRLTYEQLKAAGLDLRGVSLTKVTLSNRGQNVPVYVSGKGKFGPGVYIEFYGQALDTMYTDTNVYTLQVTKTSGPRIAVTNVVPGRVAPPASYLETLVVNRQRVYASYTPSEDSWYDTSMMVYKTPKSWSFPFEINGLADANASTNLDLTVWGVTGSPFGGESERRNSGRSNL